VQGLSIALVGAIFVASLATVVGLGLFVISVVMRARARHRKRLSRVGRRRLAGHIDMEEARLNLLKRKSNTSAMDGVTDTLSKFLPLLNTTRLRANFHRAGMSMTVSSFVLFSVLVAAVITTMGVYFSGAPVPVVAVPGLVLGMVVMDWFVKMRGNAMANKFMHQMPDALDTIIRGIRSGLPVVECIGTVGEEFDAPIGPHFRVISERVALGETLDQSLWGVARVIDRPEMDFMAVCIAIQIETGGSLSEALGNLADLLRRRQQMKLKIKAISSEAKASAMIIGALPFVMLGLLSIMSPDYVAPLFTDPRGQMMLAAGGTSIAMGAFVMWRMTQFEI
jgi:tight adherence protein B